MRISRRKDGKTPRVGGRAKTLVALLGGALAVLPAVAASNGAADWVNLASSKNTGNAGLESGYDPGITLINVNGTLPQPPKPIPLPALELPSGPLGIPGTALKAYHNADTILTREQPRCHIDWALIASIGRIESNHARGGYVDDKGNTLEPILGPVLNGVGPVAAIPDTDGGAYDGDTVWDRAVGPTQFIPSTWRGYASDGNGDGQTNPNNIFDATVGTGRYLCSGGLDLANMDQLRAAVFRYNNSDEYVNTVILWAQAYRNGVAPLPDSDVPIGAPSGPAAPAAAPGPAPVTPPPAPVTPPAQQPGSPGGGPGADPGTSIPGGGNGDPQPPVDTCPKKPPEEDPTITTPPTVPPGCTTPPGWPTTTPSTPGSSSGPTT